MLTLLRAFLVAGAALLAVPPVGTRSVSHGSVDTGGAAPLTLLTMEAGIVGQSTPASGR